MRKSLWYIYPPSHILSPLIVHRAGSSEVSSDCQVSWHEGMDAPWTHLRSLNILTHTPTHTWDWQVTLRWLLTTEPAGEVGFSKEPTPFLRPSHGGSSGRVQTGSPTSDCVFVGTQEPWQQQQVEEVNQRQDVVAEQAGCKQRERGRFVSDSAALLHSICDTNILNNYCLTCMAFDNWTKREIKEMNTTISHFLRCFHQSFNDLSSYQLELKCGPISWIMFFFYCTVQVKGENE